MNTELLNLKKQLHDLSMKTEIAIDKGECSPQVKEMVWGAIEPYKHMISLIVKYLENEST